VYTIGEISTIVKISANTLRYYDEIGLLKPSLIKNSNQYRYYSNEQIKDITFILELKQYGFTLYEIKDLMENRNDHKLKCRLEEKRIKLYKEIDRLKENSILLEKRISEIIRANSLKMKGGKVLIVDDLALARIMIKNIIEEYGYTVVGEASNGQEAISAYEELEPDVVIMDIIMPKMDGIDATKEITKKYKNAKVIMCSEINNADIIQEGIKAGAVGFITKPLSSLKLIDAIVRSFDDSYNFFNQINEECSNKYKNPVVGHSIAIEEKILKYLKNKFTEISEELSANFKDDCLINLLTVENITMGEFKALMNNGNIIGVVKYEVPYSAIYIQIYGEFKNEQEIAKELINNIANNISLFLPKYNEIDIMLSTANIISSIKDYECVLLSFSLEFVVGSRVFAAISIPHDILHSLIID
jgi:two-component system chemotaxis response regulator CheY